MAQGTFREHNIVAAFATQQQADAAAERIRRETTSADVVVGGRADTMVSLKGEMVDEMDNSVAGPAIVPMDEQMSKGAAGGILGGAIAGAIIGAVVGLIPMFHGLPLSTRVIIFAVVGAAAGATIGFVAGGGFGDRISVRNGHLVEDPMLESGTELAAQRGVVVGVHSDNEADIERARNIVRGEAVRVDKVSRTGVPVERLD